MVYCHHFLHCSRQQTAFQHLSSDCLLLMISIATRSESEQAGQQQHTSDYVCCCLSYCGLQQTATCVSHTQQHFRNTAYYSLVHSNYIAQFISTVRPAQPSWSCLKLHPISNFQALYNMQQHFCFTAYTAFASLDQFSQLSSASTFIHLFMHLVAAINVCMFSSWARSSCSEPGHPQPAAPTAAPDAHF